MYPTLKGSHRYVEVRPLQGRILSGACTGGDASVARLRLTTAACPRLLSSSPPGILKQALSERRKPLTQYSVLSPIVHGVAGSACACPRACRCRACAARRSTRCLRSAGSRSAPTLRARKSSRPRWCGTPANGRSSSRPSRSRRHLSLGFLLTLRPLVRGEHALAQAYGLGRDFDELVVGDELQRLFEREFLDGN